jgi:hypothetical protein
VLSLVLAVALGGLGLAGSAAGAPPRGVTCGDTISAPGHYFLIGNCSTGFGISINASDVKLKLDGHTMTGSGCCSLFVHGSRVTVQGPGTITGYDDGIVVDGNRDKVVGTTVFANGSGISVFGRGNEIVANKANSNDNNPGIELFPGATATKVVANTTNRNGVGILLDRGATANEIHGNTALGNVFVDLEDDNPGCDSNEWSGNHFATSNRPSCIH